MNGQAHSLRILLFLQLFSVWHKADCAFVSNRRMPWTLGFNSCQLVNKEEFINDTEHYRAWVGALSVYTPWMKHEGCFENTKTIDMERKSFKDNSPSRCSYQCRKYKYFALMGNLCRCANRTRASNNADQVRCNHHCSASRKDRCGSSDSKYVSLFWHVTGKYKPQNVLPQIDIMRDEIVCSVVVVVNRTFRVEAEHCWKKHEFICQQNEKVLRITETYHLARQICHQAGGNVSDIVTKFHLNSGKHWTDIHRIRMIRWLANETMEDLCNEFGSVEKMKCILADYKSAKRVFKIPTKCTEWHHVLCSHDRNPTVDDIELLRGCGKYNQSTEIMAGEFSKETNPRTTIRGLSSMRNTYHYRRGTVTASYRTTKIDMVKKTTLYSLIISKRTYEQSEFSTLYKGSPIGGFPGIASLNHPSTNTVTNTEIDMSGFIEQTTLEIAENTEMIKQETTGKIRSPVDMTNISLPDHDTKYSLKSKDSTEWSNKQSDLSTPHIYSTYQTTDDMRIQTEKNDVLFLSNNIELTSKYVKSTDWSNFPIPYSDFAYHTTGTVPSQTQINYMVSTRQDIRQSNIYIIIQISVISLSVFCINIAVISLLVANFNYRKRKSESLALSQGNHYLELQPMDYDDLQVPMSSSNTQSVVEKTAAVESHYVEIF